MIKYLIHFRSLTLICLYLGGRRGSGSGGGGGGGAVGEGEGEELSALASIFQYPSWHQFNLLRPSDSKQKKETEATNEIYITGGCFGLFRHLPAAAFPA